MKILNAFSQRKTMFFIKISLNFCSPEPFWQRVSIGSTNDLHPPTESMINIFIV